MARLGPHGGKLIYHFVSDFLRRTPGGIDKLKSGPYA